MEKDIYLQLTKEEVSILCIQLASRADELGVIIREKAKRNQNFDNQYELKKTLESILQRLYQIL